MTLSKEQLQDGARLLAAATPGPWTVDHEGQYITVRAGDTTPLMEMWANGRGKRRKDADAIAWLRTHAAELIADAGRYQWLRDDTDALINIGIEGTAMDVDAEIDAARASGTEGAC